MIVDHQWDFFTPEEDARLLQLHEEEGNSWKRIASMSQPERDRTVIKHRIGFLEQTRSNNTRLNRPTIPTLDQLTPEISQELSQRFEELSAKGLDGFLVFLGIRRPAGWGWE